MHHLPEPVALAPLEELMADAAPVLARYLARTQALYVIRMDREGTIQSCSQALASRLEQPVGQLIGQSLWPLLTAPDAQTLRQLIQPGQPVAPEQMLLNFVDAHDFPYTLQCLLHIQPDSLLLIGEAPARQEQSMVEQLFQLNNELAVLSREHTRQNRALEQSNGRLREEVAARRRAEEQVRLLNAQLEQRVAERTAQLEATVVTLHGEVAERRRAEGIAQRAWAEAEVASAAKSEFLSRMSHELYTPLNAILGFGQILEMRDFGPSDNETIDHILRAGHRLLRMVDHLLEISRFDEERVARAMDAVDVPDGEGVALPPTQAAAEAATHTRQHTILAIQHSPASGTLIARLLRKMEAVRLLTALPGDQGLEVAREQQPDLILLDLHLPDILGEEVLRRLQDDPQTQAIPVVVLGDKAAPGNVARLQAAGAAAYLTKPLDVQRFLATLEEFLPRERVER